LYFVLLGRKKELDEALVNMIAAILLWWKTRDLEHLWRSWTSPVLPSRKTVEIPRREAKGTSTEPPIGLPRSSYVDTSLYLVGLNTCKRPTC